MSPKRISIYLPFGRTDVTMADEAADKLVDALVDGRHASWDRTSPPGKTVINPAHVSMIETTDVP